MKKIITTTTIRPPSEAIKKFDSLEGWTLIVVGDLKTPKDYKLKNGIYFSPQEQEKYNKKLSDAIGWNNHGRRNFGHLLAKDMGADVVATVDDDNIPLPCWGKGLLVGRVAEVNYYTISIDAFDPIGLTNYSYLWHRGFPLQLVYERKYDRKEKKKIKVDVQADFWNGDPDVDAVCRMIYAPECKFKTKYFPFSSNRPSPFNSQNSFISKKALPYYFVLPHVSPLGREGDIWIAYHLFSEGFKVAYCKPSVYQKRNMHNLGVDMKDEFIGYKKNIEIVRAITSGTYKKESFWPARTRRAYEIYRRCFK